MGFYYGDSEPPPKDDRPGCMDALVITRAMFSVLFWPMLALVLVMLDAGAIFLLFAVHPALRSSRSASGRGIWLYARWEQQHFRPPGI
jgi:hypothetical protein